MQEMDAIYERVGGLDVHKKSVVACCRRLMPSGRVKKEVCTFGSTTPELLSLFGVAARMAGDTRGDGIHRCVLEAGVEHPGRSCRVVVG